MTKKKRRAGITAEELVAQLAADPDYQAKKAEFDNELAQRAEQSRLAEAPIVEDIRAVGVNVQSVWDLVNTDVPYYPALPVLIGYLESGDFPPRVMEGVGRALAVGPAIEYWDRLLAVYRTASNEGQIEGAAVAIAACATEESFVELADLLSEEARGATGILFLRPIRDFGGEAGRELLESLSEHAEFGKEATALLSQ